MENSEENVEEPAGGGFQIEQLKSYLDFGRYALRKRWILSVGAIAIGLTLTTLVMIYIPRTFTCTTALMTVTNSVLDGRGGENGALAGAADLVMRHENLESIIRDIDLVHKVDERRPPLLKFKDRIVSVLSTPQPEKIRLASLVGTLETRITVTAEKGDLTISVDWTDGKTAAELAAAARDSFLRARHSAEISAFEEKMTILDGHANRLRDDIGQLAQQLKAVRDEKIGEVRAAQSEANKANAAALAAAQPRIVVSSAPRSIPADTQTPELKTKLEGLKSKLTATEADREQRLRSEEAKLEDLKLKFTANHPQVIAQGEKVAMLSQVPSEVALMRAEVKDLQAEIRQREGALGQAGGSVAMARAGAATAGAAALLPPDISELLQRDNLDPALTAQLSSTVIKFGTLRDELLTTQIELDTAQAAFNHRYQVIIPADVPLKPTKPKPAVIIGAGLFISLLLALLLPILTELRKGVIVERWQVEHLQLPVLAELRLPPYSPD